MLSDENRAWVREHWASDTESIYEERAKLVEYSLNSNSAPDERKDFRLGFLRFKLDAIEDALYGPSLDEYARRVTRIVQRLPF